MKLNENAILVPSEFTAQVMPVAANANDMLLPITMGRKYVFIRKQSYFYKHLLHRNLSGKEIISLHQPFFLLCNPKLALPLLHTCLVTKGTDFFGYM